MRQYTEKQIWRIQEEGSGHSRHGRANERGDRVERGEHAGKGDAVSPYVVSVKPAIDNNSIALNSRSLPNT